MRRLVVTLVSITAMLAGFYISARHFAEPLPSPVAQSISRESLIGSVRPDFELGSNNGELISLNDFEGKTILINFWATWCAPCREEMPMLMELQRVHGASGLQVVGIALDNAEQVNHFVRTYGITYPILVGEADVFETSAAYGNTEGVLPYSVLIDKNGIVRWNYAGIIRHEKINGLLNEFL
jgi:peroxiredoxin